MVLWAWKRNDSVTTTGKQHRHAQQLGERRDIAGLIGDAEAGANDLGDVVNGAAEEYTDRRMIEMEKER